MLNNYGIDLDDMFNDIKQYIKEDTLIIGYNVGFDYAFLNQVFLKFTGNPLKNDLLDVLAMYKDRYSYPHRLCDAILKFNVSIPNSHRAIDDVKATFEVLKELIKIDNDMICYVNKLGYNPKYPVYNKIPNCKYIPQRGANFEIKNDK